MKVACPGGAMHEAYLVVLVSRSAPITRKSLPLFSRPKGLFPRASAERPATDTPCRPQRINRAQMLPAFTASMKAVTSRFTSGAKT